MNARSESTPATHTACPRCSTLLLPEGRGGSRGGLMLCCLLYWTRRQLTPGGSVMMCCLACSDSPRQGELYGDQERECVWR
jgi:hypothetical protein